MRRRIGIGLAVLLLAFALLQWLLTEHMGLAERWRILQKPQTAYPLLFTTSLLWALLSIALITWLRFGWRRLGVRRWFAHLSVRGKLMCALGFLSTFPVILLVLLAYWVTSSSIEKWMDEKAALALEEAFEVSAAINQFHIDTMAYYAELFALDEILQRRLLNDRGVPSRAEKLAQELDQYELAIYDRRGRRVFATDPQLLPLALEDLAVSLDQLQENVPVTGERDVGEYGLLFSLIPVFSSQGGLDGPVGVVVVAHPSPFTHTEQRIIREKAERLRERIGAREITYRDIQAGRPQARQLVLLGLVLSSVVVLAVALWVSAQLSKSLTVPINALVEGTRHVARGDLDYQVEVHSQDEFALLARSFNQMIQDLKKAAEERKRSEELAVWRDVARKMAHEIKNPLTPIQLSAQRLYRRYHMNPEGFEEVLEQCTRTILREVESARRWLDAFSMLARMPDPAPEPVDLCQVLQQALAAVSVWPPGVQRVTDWPQEGIPIQADGEQLHRAFFNLIKNALESMEGEGTLSVRAWVEPSGKQAGVEICDTGPGIPPEILPKLFVPHFSTKREGMGLGLAIVKKIVDDHHGHIEVAQGKSGTGACFRILLPLKFANGDAHEQPTESYPGGGR